MLYRQLLTVVFTFSFYSSSFSAFNNASPGISGASGGAKVQPEEWRPAQWLKSDVNLGQVGGITVDQNDTIYIFHRADRLWGGPTFTIDNIYTEQYKGPISESTIIMVDKNGRVLKKFGEHIFYLPHGITVDHEFNIWVTDVALHQVMKFKPSSNDAVLVKGARFTPGRDSSHFCKPAAVAVLRSGDFFVADGYCNSRIVKFDPEGKKILEWGRSTVYPGMRQPEPAEFFIPHALTVTQEENLLCVADRENGRVQCFHPQNGTFSPELSNLPAIGRTVYSVAFSNYSGGSFVLVNGPPQYGYPARGFIASPDGKVISTFGSNLRAPHDVAVSSDGNEIYVAEITTDGTRALKFVRNQTFVGEAKKACRSSTTGAVKKQDLVDLNEDKGLAGAIVITSACLIFSVAIVFSAYVYRRSRTYAAKDTESLLPHSDI